MNKLISLVQPVEAQMTVKQPQDVVTHASAISKKADILKFQAAFAAKQKTLRQEASQDVQEDDEDKKDVCIQPMLTLLMVTSPSLPWHRQATLGNNPIATSSHGEKLGAVFSSQAMFDGVRQNIDDLQSPLAAGQQTLCASSFTPGEWNFTLHPNLKGGLANITVAVRLDRNNIHLALAGAAAQQFTGHHLIQLRKRLSQQLKGPVFVELAKEERRG